MILRWKLTFIALWIPTLLAGCGEAQFLSDVLRSTSGANSGDILIVSGGTVARTVAPYPLHRVSVFYSDGTYKAPLRIAGTIELFMGMALASNGLEVLLTVDSTDRVERVNLDAPSIYGNHIIDTAQLSGTTLRTVATLSDGGTIVAESPTIIEKYDSSSPPARVTTNFPITLTGNIMKLRKISGDRFVALTTGGNPDSPRVYNNNGTLAGTIALGLPCGNNCDPTDIVELPDGRFLVSVQIAAQNSIEIYNSSFVRIQQFYRDLTVLQAISAMALTPDGNVLACSSSFNTCEKIQVVGNSGVRMGSSAFIDDVSVMRQPTDILVVP